MVKKYIPLIAFLITALFFSFSQAYAYTEITDCTTITSPGEYRLTQDIIDFPGTVCIDIKSNDVILDCEGHLIDGVVPNDYSYGVGINIDGYSDNTVYSNITIKDCALGEWYAFGIYSFYTSNVRILNSTFTYGSLDYGEAIRFDHSENCYVDNVTSYRLIDIMDQTRGCYLNNLYLYREYAGIMIDSSGDIVVNNTQMIKTQDININNCDHINVTNAYIAALYNGISLTSVEFSNFNNIEVYGVDIETFYGIHRANYGIFIEWSNFNNFTDITISNFKHEGIWLGRWSDGNTFINVSISDIVEGDGIGVSVWKESNENYFKGLTIRNTSYAGIFLDFYPAYNVFEDFTISDISGNGIWFTQVQDTNEFRNGRIENIHTIVDQEESTGNGIRLEGASNQVFHEVKIKNSDKCGVSLWGSENVPTQGNLFYNNIFMNKNNTCFEGVVYTNYWNTTLKRGKNILGGPYIGGNFWGRPDGKSILDELKYAIIEGIYDRPYDLLGDGSNVDYHPLARVVFVVPPIFKSFVGLGMGIAFIMGAITLLFGIDFSKNPLSSIVLAMIGLAVMLLMFTYLWEML